MSSFTILTSRYGLRKVKTLPSNTAVSFIEEIYEEGFGTAEEVKKKQDTPGMIRFETKKSQHPSGKYLNYTLVRELVTPIKDVKIKGLSNPSILAELESLNYSIIKGTTIFGSESSFSGSIVFGKPLQMPTSKKDLGKEIPKEAKGRRILSEIFDNIKGEIGFSENESYSFSSTEDQIAGSAALEIKQNKYLNLRSLEEEPMGNSGSFYQFTIESSSFDGNGNVLGSITKSYNPKNKTATIADLKSILEQNLKSSAAPSKSLDQIKTLGYKYKTNTKFFNIKKVETIEKWLIKYGPRKALIFGRFIPFARTLINPVCGVVK